MDAILDQLYAELEYVKNVRERKMFQSDIKIILNSKLTFKEKELALLALLAHIEDKYVV